MRRKLGEFLRKVSIIVIIIIVILLLLLIIIIIIIIFLVLGSSVKTIEVRETSPSLQFLCFCDCVVQCFCYKLDFCFNGTLESQ